MQRASAGLAVALLLAVLGTSAVGGQLFLQSNAPGTITSGLPQCAPHAILSFLTLPSDDPTLVLTEEDPTGGFYNFAGSLKWSVENGSSGPVARGDVWIRATIVVPQRHLTLMLALRRVVQSTASASHLIELDFNSPGRNFLPFGDSGHDDQPAIAQVEGITAKQDEFTRGVRLAGDVIHVTRNTDLNVYLIVLSGDEKDRARNLMLLAERDWFDLALRYDDGRRAILAIGKGALGRHAFHEALKMWEVAESTIEL